MFIKSLLITGVILCLIGGVNSQAVVITVPAFSNVSWAPAPCPTFNVGIWLQYRSTETVNFEVYDNLHTICATEFAPAPYPALTTPEDILYVGSPLAACVDNKNICFSFVNPFSTDAVVTYQLTYVCKNYQCV